MSLCECGCGKPVRLEEHRFLIGHASKGKKRSEGFKRGISETFEVDVLNIECDKDHFHMLFKSKPTLDIPKYMNAIKTITSREIQRNFQEIKELLWDNTFWSPSYFLATTGQLLSMKNEAPCES